MEAIRLSNEKIKSLNSPEAIEKATVAEVVNVKPLKGKKGKLVPMIGAQAVRDCKDVIKLHKAKANLKHARPGAPTYLRPELDAHIKAINGQIEWIKENLTAEEIAKNASESSPVMLNKATGMSELAPDFAGKKRFQVLQPMRGMMRAALEAKGVTPAKRYETLVNQFYNEVVCGIKGKNLKGKPDFYQHYEKIDLATAPVNHLDDYGDAITNGILSAIAVARNKAASGQELSKVERILVDGSTKVEQQIETQAREEAAGRLGESILFSRRTQVIILLVVIAIIGITVAIVK